MSFGRRAKKEREREKKEKNNTHRANTTFTTYVVVPEGFPEDVHREEADLKGRQQPAAHDGVRDDDAPRAKVRQKKATTNKKNNSLQEQGVLARGSREDI